MIPTLSVKDAIDILLVAMLLYHTYRLMKDSGSIKTFLGILIFIVVWAVVSQVLEMRLLGSILDKFISVGSVALIIIFQEEIRRFFLTLGSHNRLSSIWRLFKPTKRASDVNPSVMPVVMACINMSRGKVGALIVVEKNVSLDDISETGEAVDAILSQRLIENIFFKNSPLHDGAMVISRGRIKAAGCILPVSHSLDIPPQFGLRHRAALGISQESDALAIIVSEETGHITVAHKGVFSSSLSGEELERLLNEKM